MRQGYLAIYDQMVTRDKKKEKTMEDFLLNNGMKVDDRKHILYPEVARAMLLAIARNEKDRTVLKLIARSQFEEVKTTIAGKMEGKVIVFFCL